MKIEQRRAGSTNNILASTAPSLQREGVKPYELNIFADPTAPHPYQPDGSNMKEVVTKHFPDLPLELLSTTQLSTEALLDTLHSYKSNTGIIYYSYNHNRIVLL